MDGSIQHYYDMLKIAYEEIKNYDQSITVVGISASTLYGGAAPEPGGGLMKDLYEMGAAHYLDAVSFHIYQHWLTGFTEVYGYEFTAAQALEKAQDLFLGKPIWITEVGTINVVGADNVAYYLRIYFNRLEASTKTPETIIWHRFWGKLSTLITNSQQNEVFYAFQENTI